MIKFFSKLVKYLCYTQKCMYLHTREVACYSKGCCCKITTKIMFFVVYRYVPSIVLKGTPVTMKFKYVQISASCILLCIQCLLRIIQLYSKQDGSATQSRTSSDREYEIQELHQCPYLREWKLAQCTCPKQILMHYQLDRPKCKSNWVS